MDTTYTDLLRDCLKNSHETLEGTMQGVTDEVAHYQPAGKALPIAAAYVHAIVSEDLLLNMMVRKTPSLLDTGWAEKLGTNAPHPAMDETWETTFPEWTKNLKVDLAAFQQYSQAVYAQTDEYLASLKDEDLMTIKADLSAWGMGEWTLAKFVIRMLNSHIDSITGEISAIKGVQGLKGYPF